MFWVIAGLMAVGVLALVLRTLTGRGPAEGGPALDDVDVCRAQLAELERDVQAGMVSAEDADASRLEIERRMLRASERQGETVPVSSPAAAAKRRMAAVVALALMPLAAVGLYLALGHPEMPGKEEAFRHSGGTQGTAVAQGAAGEKQPSLEVMVGRLEERLKASPEDVQGWGLLGRSYTVLGQYEKAVGAYRKAAALKPDAAEVQSGLGEALVLAAGEQVSPEALRAFTKAHALDPSDPAARFYLGMADYERGKFQAALDAWVALERDAPANAPWLPDLRSRITALARQLGVDPKTVVAEKVPVHPAASAGNAQASPPAAAQMPNGRRGPTAQDMQAAAQMNSNDRQAMIRSMVSGLEARLKANPDDQKGWRMLARSRQVLGEPDKAAEALRHLAELRPDDPSAQGDYAQALVQRDEAGGERLSDQTVAALGNVLKLDENNTQALFFLGKARAQRGDRAQAETLWRRLIQHAPESEPLREQAEALLKAASSAE